MANAAGKTNLIPRALTLVARERLRSYPVLVITGPRQSGKTTLARALDPGRAYFSLEDPDTRAFATDDPRGFLDQAGDGAILDEVQRCPDLLSYLQGVIDAKPGRLGRYILTGSSQFELLQSVSQSLAGRAAMLTLHPFSLAELQATKKAPVTIDSLLYAGLYPPVYDRSIEPSVWLQDYVATYLERDVRQIVRVKDLSTFQRFVQLCAGRIGQLLNVSSLAADAGITRITADAWLSVLEASHLIHVIRPWFTNISKRQIKSPKLYFSDVGLAAWLLGVRKLEHLPNHPQRGMLFENWVITEMIKARTNRGLRPEVHFLRDQQGHEIDAVVETSPDTLQAVEIKSGATVAGDFFKGLDYWRDRLDRQTMGAWLIYGGESKQTRSQAKVLPWARLSPLLDALRQ